MTREKTIFEKYGYSNRPDKEQLKQFGYMLALEELNRSHINRRVKPRHIKVKIAWIKSVLVPEYWSQYPY